MKNPLILVINPGSTSTKIAVFKAEEMLEEVNIIHSVEDIKMFDSIASQLEYRKLLVVETLKDKGFNINDFDVVMGRGGVVKPIESGVYEVNETLKKDLIDGTYGMHASNLGGIIASDIALECGCKAYIADPVVVDEMIDIARIGGHKLFPRRSIFHALNQKAVARAYAKSKGIAYEELNIIVAHMGGGVSVGAHKKGRVVDVNQALDGEGAFSPERSGTLPAGDLVKLCFDGKHTFDEVYKMIVGEGGVNSYLNTNNFKTVIKSINHNKESELIVKAFIYNIAKQIGSYSIIFKGKVDAIILTGGITYDNYVCDEIKSYVSHIAETTVFAGENEMNALAINGLMVYRDEVVAKEYI